MADVAAKTAKSDITKRSDVLRCKWCDLCNVHKACAKDSTHKLCKNYCKLRHNMVKILLVLRDSGGILPLRTLQGENFLIG